MSAIALDRYLYLIESKMDRKRRTVRRAFLLIGLTWFIPAVIWIPGTLATNEATDLFVGSRRPRAQLRGGLLTTSPTRRRLLSASTCSLCPGRDYSPLLLADDRHDCSLHQNLLRASWSDEQTVSLVDGIQAEQWPSAFAVSRLRSVGSGYSERQRSRTSPDLDGD